MATKIYICPVCGSYFSTFASAANCCDPEIEEFWICDVCDKEYSAEDSADYCCDENGDDK